MGAAITGWGSALPDKIVTNADFAARLDTTDGWIVARTGISERRVGGTTSQLATEAARRALAVAGVEAADVGLVVLATTTPDQVVPATSVRVQDALGVGGGAFDLNAACAGFVYALITVAAMIDTGAFPKVLLIGADTLSPITDQDDRGTAVLFGDGAGAVLLESRPGRPLLLGSDLGADGSGVGILYCDHGGYISMDGREVYRRAVRATTDSARQAMKQAGVTSDEISLFVPHQANLRIIESVNERIGLDLERTALVLDKTGNTSAASIPLALAGAADAGRLREGDLVLLSGFGAGMTWASAVMRWGTRSVGR